MFLKLTIITLLTVYVLSIAPQTSTPVNPHIYTSQSLLFYKLNH